MNLDSYGPEFEIGITFGHFSLNNPLNLRGVFIGKACERLLGLNLRCTNQKLSNLPVSKTSMQVVLTSNSKSPMLRFRLPRSSALQVLLASV